MSSAPAGRPRALRSGRIAAVAGVALGVALSLVRRGYQFDGYYSDDAMQAPLVLHKLHPELLADDRLIQLIAGRYQSALLDLVALLVPTLDLHVAYFLLFLLARVLTLVAVHRLTRTLTASAAAATISVLLVAAAPISYVGGVGFVETILTPRGLAVPLALFGLDAFFRRRMVAMATWVGACLAVHPVTGLNLFGVIAFCGVCFPGSVPRREFRRAVAALALGIVAIGFWTKQLGAPAGPLRFDSEWAKVIAETVGPWVYLHLQPAAALVASAWIPFFGAIGIAVVGSPELRNRFGRVAAAALVALVVHAVGVDALEIRPLFYASPQRATLALSAVSVAAASLWIAESLRQRDPLRRILALAFLVASLLLEDLEFALLFGVLLAGAWALRGAAVAPRWRAFATLALIAAVLGSTWPHALSSFQLRPARVQPRLARLGTLGLDPDWVTLQEYIRLHSEVGDVVMPPMPLSPRLFAQRPSTLTWKMQSFTHVSRAFAFEFMEWRRAVGVPMQSADTAEAISLARRVGARWLVLDDRETPVAPDEPRPTVRAGPYRAYRLAPANGRPDDERRP